MKRFLSYILIATLALLSLAGCIRPGQAASTPFDSLARWVPGDATMAFFLDLKPAGEMGRHWERIRQRMEANPAGQQALDGLYGEFRLEEYGLAPVITGPAVSVQGDIGRAVVAQVSDEQAVTDLLLEHFVDVAWEQEEYERHTLYHGRDLDSWQGRERIAWTVYEGFLFLSYSYDRVVDRAALIQLQDLLSLAQGDSLAGLPAWRTLCGRLPEHPMGLMFFNVAAQVRSDPPAPGDQSLGAALNRQVVATALAAVPEEEGMRVEIAATADLQESAPAELRALFDLPTVDPAAWTHLPADTAFTLVGYDISVLWPVLEDMFNLDSLALVRDAVGLDMEADLASAEGPLTGDFALALTPPLPDQPISQGVPAGQLLILARGTSEPQAAGVQAAMEGRGAVFGPEEVEGISLRTQAGTRPTGYAISYGFDGDTYLFGSSPNVIGRAVAAQREDEGLVTTEAFRATRAALPGDPSLFIYFNPGALTSLAQANMTAERYQNNLEYVLFEAFDGIALGLRLPRDGQMGGVIYFYVR
jgi:hypothetical protein